MISILGDIFTYLLIGTLTIWIWLASFRGHRNVPPSSWRAVRVPRKIAIAFAGAGIHESILDVFGIGVQTIMLSAFVGMILQDLGIVPHAGIVLFLSTFLMTVLIVIVFFYDVWRKWRQR